jgi:hypothetical protein
VTFLCANIRDHHSKLDDSDCLLEANLGLLKVDDVPDRGEILQEQIGHFFAGKEI